MSSPPEHIHIDIEANPKFATNGGSCEDVDVMSGNMLSERQRGDPYRDPAVRDSGFPISPQVLDMEMSRNMSKRVSISDEAGKSPSAASLACIGTPNYCGEFVQTEEQKYRADRVNFNDRPEFISPMSHRQDRSHYDSAAPRYMDVRHRVHYDRDSYHDGSMQVDQGRIGPRKPIIMPDKYDGTGSWEDYQAHFETCAKINDWSNDTKAKFLAVSLRGSAQMLLGDLSIPRRENYHDLVAELIARFGHEGQAELFRVQLKNRMKLSKETFPELAQDLKRLVARAYPSAPAALQEILTKDQFVDSLTDSDMRLRIKQSKPLSLSKMVQLAIELEAYDKAEKHMSPMSNIKRTVRSTVTTDNDTDHFSALQTKIEELTKQLNSLQQGNQGSKKYNRGQRRSDRPNKVCWICREEGHFQSKCPKNNDQKLSKGHGKALK